MFITTSFNRVVGDADLLFPLFILSLGVEESKLGIIFSYRMAVAMLATFVVGYLCDRFDQRRLYIVGLLILGSAYGVFFVTHHILLGLLGIFLLWVGATIPAISWRALVSRDIPKERQGKTYAWITTSSTLFGALMIFIGSQIAQAASYQWMYLYFGLGFWLMALLAQRMMPVTQKGAVKITSQATPVLKWREHWKLLHSNREFFLFNLSMLVVFCGAWISYPYFPALLIQKFNLSIGDIGLLASIVTLGLALFLPFIGEALDRYSNRKVLFTLILLSALAVGLLPMMPHKIFFLLFAFLAAICWYFWVFANIMIPYVNTFSHPDQRGLSIGIFFITLQVGSGIGAALASFLIRFVTLSQLFMISSLVVFLGGLTFYLLPQLFFQKEASQLSH